MTERESLAALWGIRKFRFYVEGSHFTIITGHNSLTGWKFHRAISGLGVRISTIRLYFTILEELPKRSTRLTIKVISGRRVRDDRNCRSGYVRANYRSMVQKFIWNSCKGTSWPSLVQDNRWQVIYVSFGPFNQKLTRRSGRLKATYSKKNNDNPSYWNAMKNQWWNTLRVATFYYLPTIYRNVVNYVQNAKLVNNAKYRS